MRKFVSANRNTTTEANQHNTTQHGAKKQHKAHRYKLNNENSTSNVVCVCFFPFKYSLIGFCNNFVPVKLTIIRIWHLITTKTDCFAYNRHIEIAWCLYRFDQSFFLLLIFLAKWRKWNEMMEINRAHLKFDVWPFKFINIFRWFKLFDFIIESKMECVWPTIK